MQINIEPKFLMSLTLQDFTRTGCFTKLPGCARDNAAVLVGDEEGRSQDLRIPPARPRNVGHSRLAGLAGDSSGRMGGKAINYSSKLARQYWSYHSVCVSPTIGLSQWTGAPFGALVVLLGGHEREECVGQYAVACVRRE